MSKKIVWALSALLLLVFLSVALYQLPSMRERLARRISEAIAQVRYAINPPEQVVFVPEDTPQPTQAPPTETSTATPEPTSTATQPGPTPTTPPSATPTSTATPLPGEASLKGITHEYQKWNNCGPATLAMALSFWGWKGDGAGDLQSDVAPLVKPNQRDKNVMPYELADYVIENTGLQAVVRAGGDMELLKRLIAAGFPVMVEKGFDVPGEYWMGHYEVLSGYDDAAARFTAQDSYIMADLPVPYEQLRREWRAFNYTFLVIYPPEREAEVRELMGIYWDETASYQAAAQKASDEIYSQQGRELAFAWYNRGTSLVMLQDYAGAAAAYDEYFKVYAELPEEERPWRIIWYQTGPYFAYFYSGRYNDVINLATTTLVNINEPAIEESYYWRAMARAALGDTQGAIEDYRTSLKWHEGFSPSLYQLELLGAGGG